MILTRACEDLDEEVRSLIRAGYRLDMIMPADAPREAIVSRADEKLRLQAPRNPRSAIPDPQSKRGRAGMEYRDLIPDRLGGFLIASHIRIPKGGEVADYTHYHKLLFQMIYCKAGWVRVVYEDQGPPFAMNAGDCVLQPPEIRHRVLEASAGAEVIEVSSPAVHETWVDHEIQLPTPGVNRERDFHGQKFVRYVGADADWRRDSSTQWTDTGIAAATNDRADVRVVKLSRGAALRLRAKDSSFVYILDGEMLTPAERVLRTDDCFTVPPDERGAELIARVDTKLLQVTVSQEIAHFFFATSVPTDFEP